MDKLDIVKALVYVVGCILGGLKLVDSYHGLSAIKDAVINAVRRQAVAMAFDPQNLDVAREYLEKAAEAALAKAGVKPTKTIKYIVHSAVELVLNEVAQRLLAAQVNELAAAAAKVPEKFTPPPAASRTVPRLDIDIEELKDP
jgi:hypothetical protein